MRLASQAPEEMEEEEQHSLASEMAPPCSSIFPFDMARLFQNVASFGLSEIASVYNDMERLNSFSTIKVNGQRRSQR